MSHLSFLLCHQAAYDILVLFIACFLFLPGDTMRVNQTDLQFTPLSTGCQTLSRCGFPFVRLLAHAVLAYERGAPTPWGGAQNSHPKW